jgi:hypothetical protein
LLWKIKSALVERDSRLAHEVFLGRHGKKRILRAMTTKFESWSSWQQVHSARHDDKLLTSIVEIIFGFRQSTPSRGRFMPRSQTFYLASKFRGIPAHSAITRGHNKLVLVVMATGAFRAP